MQAGPNSGVVAAPRDAAPPAVRLNPRVDSCLRDIANLLEQQGAEPFRILAYRRASDSVASLDRDVTEIMAREGFDGLTQLPAIGRGIATTIYEIVATGRSSRLERLRGTLDPVKLFQTVPGIGPELAERIHDTLHVDTLEALEIAAHDGRLEALRGIGPRRAAVLRASLDAILGRARGRRRAPGTVPVDVLLGVDDEYRRKAIEGRLRTIAPKRLNPGGRAWLPVLHARRGDWHFTALYSNTARAHELGRTRDWVVMYAYDDHHQEGQYTIVTETRGPLAGKRVVRGREAECQRHYFKDGTPCHGLSSTEQR